MCIRDSELYEDEVLDKVMDTNEIAQCIRKISICYYTFWSGVITYLLPGETALI